MKRFFALVLLTQLPFVVEAQSIKTPQSLAAAEALTDPKKVQEPKTARSANRPNALKSSARKTITPPNEQRLAHAIAMAERKLSEGSAPNERLVPPAAQTHSQFVEQAHAGLVRDALAVFYHECGFYPDTLDKLLRPTEQQPSCLHGTRQAPLADNPQNQDTLQKLTYMPFGYDDFELSIRLYWTRE